MLDKSSVHNILDEIMYFLDRSIPFNFNFLNFALLIWSSPNSSYNFWNQESVFRIIFSGVSQSKSEFSGNPNTKFIEVPQSSISTQLFLMFSLFQKYLNPQVRTNKIGNSIVYNPCPSRLALRIHYFIFL